MAYELGPAMLLMEGLETVAGTGNFAGTITADDTDIPFVDTSIYPSRGVVQLETEEILFLENDTTNNQLKQCIRGFRGTTAAAHDGSVTAIDAPLVATDLGKTNGGVTLTVSESSQTLNTDQDGETPINEVITGTTVSMEASLADITLENFAMTHKVSVEGTSGTQRVEIKPNVGSSLIDSAKKLVLVPYAGDSVSTDPEKLITIPKAGIRSAEELSFDSSTQRVIKVQFTGYPDDANNILVFGLEA